MTSRKNKPVFIALEGGEGAGKSTQAQLLVTRLQQEGRHATLVHEPGTTPLGQHLREYLKSKQKISPEGDGPAPPGDRAAHPQDHPPIERKSLWRLEQLNICPCEHGKLNQSQVASTGAGLWREGHGTSNSSSRTATILSLIAGPPPSTAPAGLACPLCLLWPNLGRA